MITKKLNKKRIYKRYWWIALKLTFITVIIVIFSSVGYMIYLYPSVTARFEGKRWAIPARVYARSLELYTGAPITNERLTYELNQLGYHLVDKPLKTGSWSLDGNIFLVRSRTFKFWDGKEPERFLSIHINKNTITSIKDKNTEQEVDLVRLEPVEIGSIYPSHSEDRVVLSPSEVPQLLIDILLVVEDRRFYSHFGIDPLGILRAIVMYAFGKRQGASTIDMQLVKNMYLTPHRNIWRKLQETHIAIILNAKYNKNDILNAYINEIYLGQDGKRGIHGFGLASYFYFGRPLKELTLAQISLLVGMLKAPSNYDPYRYPEAAKKRRNIILRILNDTGYINEKKYITAKKTSLEVSAREVRSSAGRYPAFMDMVRRQLKHDYQIEDLSSNGLRIFTTFDTWVQRMTENAIKSQLKILEEQNRLTVGKLESAVVIVTPQDGEVLAISGGRRPAYAGFNRALDASRPIGSLAKLAVYLTALKQPELYSLITLLDDSSIEIINENTKKWHPNNYDYQEYGVIPLEIALAKSYNLATVNLGINIGIESIIRTLHSLGISKNFSPYPSLLLGAIDLTPVEVAQMYQAIASGGSCSPLRVIREVLDQEGLLQHYPLTISCSSQPGPIYLLTRAMQSVVSEGTSSYLNTIMSSSLALAGKTGTTDKLKDSWFAGFSSNYVGVVWIGRDDNKTAGLSGADGALKVWGEIMRLLQPRPLDLITPRDIIKVLIDLETGLLATKNCKGAVTKPFIKGFIPKQLAPCAHTSNTYKSIFNPFNEDSNPLIN